jgi:hypothetical protein
MATFYDNPTDHIASHEATVPVERVYCLRVEECTESQLLALDQLYRSLPGWVDYLHGIPHWFGRAGAIPALSASVEPSGLVVSGTAPIDAWESWDAAFRQGTIGFHFFEV